MPQIMVLGIFWKTTLVAHAMNMHTPYLERFIQKTPDHPKSPQENPKPLKLNHYKPVLLILHDFKDMKTCLSYKLKQFDLSFVPIMMVIDYQSCTWYVCVCLRLSELHVTKYMYMLHLRVQANIREPYTYKNTYNYMFIPINNIYFMLTILAAYATSFSARIYDNYYRYLIWHF